MLRISDRGRNAHPRIVQEGYDVLVAQLRTKLSIFHSDCFKAVFAFMGIDFAHPEYASW